MTEEQYVKDVNALLMRRFGIGVGDVGEDLVVRCHQEGWHVKDAVDWFEQMCELERIDVNPYGG